MYTKNMDLEVLGFQCIGDYSNAVLVKEERWGWWRQTAIQLTTPAGPRARVIWGEQVGAVVEIWMESSNKSKTKEIIWMQGRCWFRQMIVATACNAAQGKKAIQGLNGSNFFEGTTSTSGWGSQDYYSTKSETEVQRGSNNSHWGHWPWLVRTWS